MSKRRRKRRPHRRGRGPRRRRRHIGDAARPARTRAPALRRGAQPAAAADRLQTAARTVRPASSRSAPAPAAPRRRAARTSASPPSASRTSSCSTSRCIARGSSTSGRHRLWPGRRPRAAQHARQRLVGGRAQDFGLIGGLLGPGRDGLDHPRVHARSRGSTSRRRTVARVDPLRVGHVLTEGDAARATVHPDLCRAEAEQRPRQLAVPRPHPRQAARRRVLRQPVDDGLRLIVAIVRRDDDVVAARCGELARALVPQRPGPSLEATPSQGAAELHDVQRQAGRGARLGHDAAVASRILAAHAVVNVERRQRQAQVQGVVHRPDQIEQRHGIGPAREQQQRPLPGAAR